MHGRAKSRMSLYKLTMTGGQRRLIGSQAFALPKNTLCDRNIKLGCSHILPLSHQTCQQIGLVNTGYTHINQKHSTLNCSLEYLESLCRRCLIRSCNACVKDFSFTLFPLAYPFLLLLWLKRHLGVIDTFSFSHLTSQNEKINKTRV